MPTRVWFTWQRPNALHLASLTATCNSEATPYKYLAAIKIKAIVATKTNPEAQYATSTGAGDFVIASLRLLGWAARRGMVPPSWPNARDGVAPDRPFFNWMGESNARNKADHNACRLGADHHPYSSVLGVSIGNGCLAGISSLGEVKIEEPGPARKLQVPA
jgi:hypothetical protein